MREIKFRAWSEVRNKMLTSSDITPGFWLSLRFCEYNPEGKQITFPLMQSTGLQDKNGVDIYEGDIVKWGHVDGHTEHVPRIAIVDLLHDLKFKTVNLGEYNHDFHYGCFAYARVIDKAMEVIGNIHQNKELLND